MFTDVAQEYSNKVKRLGMSYTFAPLVKSHIVFLGESQPYAAVNVTLF